MLIKNQSLKLYNTFGIEVAANYFVQIEGIQQAQELWREKRWQAMPKMVLGGGSNVLFVDDFTGLMVKNDIMGIECVKQDETHVWLTVGAGEGWHDLVCYCLSHDYAGIENLALIPGTVGAAPIQNIGAYGVEFESVFESLQAIEISTGRLVTFDHQACQFGYRDSVFKKSLKGQYMIAAVTIRLCKQHSSMQLHYDRVQATLSKMGVTEPTIQDVSAAVISLRQAKLPDPKKQGNAGSFFKNPELSQTVFEAFHQSFPNVSYFNVGGSRVKIAAAALIEQAGWKGRSLGAAAVSDKHALVLVNRDQASGRDVLTLAQKIQADIAEKFNIRLEPEVNIINGRF